MEEKICPLLSVHPDSPGGRCAGVRCAWYCEVLGECGIVTAAEAIDRIGDILENTESL